MFQFLANQKLEKPFFHLFCRFFGEVVRHGPSVSSTKIANKSKKWKKDLEQVCGNPTKLFERLVKQFNWMHKTTQKETKKRMSNKTMQDEKMTDDIDDFVDSLMKVCCKTDKETSSSSSSSELEQLLEQSSSSSSSSSSPLVTLRFQYHLNSLDFFPQNFLKAYQHGRKTLNLNSMQINWKKRM